MRLNQFLEVGLKPEIHWTVKRAHLKEPEFTDLYVRITKRYIEGVWFHPVLDIATIEAKEKGKGSFTRLVKRVRAKYPNLSIYVESVLNERFEKKLEEMGFTKLGHPQSPCFFLPPRGKQQAKAVSLKA